MNQFKLLKRLILSGAFLALLSLQAQKTEPWFIMNKPGINVGLGMVMDSNHLFFGSNLGNAPYSSYVYSINRATDEKDSLLITSSDTAAFLPFYADISDSLVILIGSVIDLTKPITATDDRRTAVVRVTKDLKFKDSLVFGSLGYDVMAFMKLKNAFYITEAVPRNFSAPGRLSKVNMYPLELDTSLVVTDTNGDHLQKDLVFNEVLNKLFVVSRAGKSYLIDTASFSVDSVYFNWNSNFPFAPAVHDLFKWKGKTMALAAPWGMSLYHYSDSTGISNYYRITNRDTLPGGEVYIRGCYGFSDSLLVFSTSGPFSAPPPQQTNTVTYVRVYAVNETGDIIWQTKIENGRNNLVHSQATDDESTFVYVRSIDSTEQAMYIYKVDDSGNVLRINEHGKQRSVGISIYPIPSTGIIDYDIEGFNRYSDRLYFKLVNASGRKFFESSIKNASGRFDFTHLPKGTYFYSFTEEGVISRSGTLILD